MAEGNNGKIYVGHAHEGFSVVDTVAKTCINHRAEPGKPSLPGDDVTSVCVDSAGYVWIGTDKGAAMYNPSTGRITPFVHGGPGSIGAGRIKSIRQMADGNIWFATSQGGISILNPKVYTFSDINYVKFSSIPIEGEPEGTSGAAITCIFPDSFGNVWIGNYRNGIDVISHIPPVLSRMDYRVNINETFVYKPAWACFQGNDGTLWVGGENEIVWFNDTDSGIVSLPFNDYKAPINTICQDSDGMLWIGSNEAGAMIYNPGKATFQRVTGVPDNIRGLFPNAPGDMWICTNYGIYSSDGKSSHRLDGINALLRDNVVQCVAKDLNGNIWIGTFGKGISVLTKDGKSICNLDMTNGFISNAINSIKCDSHGRIWVATRNGLALFPDSGNPTIHKTFPVLERLGITYVKAIEEDKKSEVWITTNKGIARLSDDGKKAALYQSSHGLPLNSFFGNGSAKGNNGKLYFSSGNGVVEVNPEASMPETSDLRVSVSNFTVFKEGRDSKDNEYSIPVNSKHVVLEHNQSTFKITFGITDIALHDDTDLSYNMKGLDNVWMETHGENTAMYRNLPPGNYRFQIRQCLKGQELGAPYTVLYIEIKPPVWLTWWAKTAYAVAIVAFIAWAAIFYKRRVNLRQRLKTEMENSRNRQNLNEERLRFYTNITHELRTPLTLILGPLEDLVSDPSLPPRYARKLKMIRESSYSLLSLINGILEFRKTETQNRKLAVAQGNIANLIREIGLRFKESNGNPKVQVDLEIDDDGKEIYFDEEIITVIINNLMSNALKYTPQGRVTLSYFIEEADGLRYSVIKVSDTGYGISKKGLPHIFDRYYQVKGEHQASGTGIGLALVKNLVVIHNATIDVTSEENVGSAFTVRFLTDSIYPDAIHREFARKPSNALSDEEPKPEDMSQEKMHILVIEDNNDIREYIRQALSDEFTVTTACNGLDGLQSVQAKCPDLIISDIMMPEMDGITLCRTLKDDIVTSHIPIILLTAKDSMDDKETGYESGADSYLTKPFSAKLLLSRIHNIIRRRRQIAAAFIGNIDKSVTQDTNQENESAGNTEFTENEGSQMFSAVSQIDREFIDKFNSVIIDNMAAQDLGVNLIADKMCMSRSTLYRKINALLGLPAADYIRKIRLTKAAEFLREGKLSVTDISYETGFSGHSSFAKAFKKEYGMTAREYIAQFRPSSNPKP